MKGNYMSNISPAAMGSPLPYDATQSFDHVRLLPELKSADAVIKELKNLPAMASEKPILKVLSAVFGAALGGFTAFALFGSMISPIGWVIAGAGLAIILAETARVGGPKEFLQELGIALAVFGMGFVAIAFMEEIIGLIGKPNNPHGGILLFELLFWCLLTSGVALPIAIDDEMSQSDEKQYREDRLYRTSIKNILGTTCMRIPSKLTSNSALASLPKDAVFITGVKKGSIAEKSGIKVNDIIIGCNKKNANLEQLAEDTKTLTRNKEKIPHVNLTILRGIEQIGIGESIKEIECDCVFPISSANFKVVDMDGALQEIDNKRGILVVRVGTNGVADRAGLHSGDFIVSLNDQAIDSEEAFNNELQKRAITVQSGLGEKTPEPCKIKVERGGKPQEMHMNFNPPLSSNDSPTAK